MSHRGTDDTLKAPRRKSPGMDVTVEVVGGETHELSVSGATYADLLGEVGLSPHEATVLVDGRPVPEDQPVAVGHVKVLRLITGG